jgi:hypothetical protein
MQTIEEHSVFDEAAIFDPFNDLLLGRCHDIVNVANIVACLNQKLVESLEDERKVEILTEVLNDIKLLMVSVDSELEH